MTPPTAAEVDALDAEYLALRSLVAEPVPPIWDTTNYRRHQTAGFEASQLALRLCQAITDHDIAVYGEPAPQEEPCPSSLVSP